MKHLRCAECGKELEVRIGKCDSDTMACPDNCHLRMKRCSRCNMIMIRVAVLSGKETYACATPSCVLIGLMEMVEKSEATE